MIDQDGSALRLAAQRILVELLLLAIAMGTTGIGTAFVVANLHAIPAFAAAMLGTLTLLVLRRHWESVMGQAAWLRFSARWRDESHR